MLQRFTWKQNAKISGCKCKEAKIQMQNNSGYKCWEDVRGHKLQRFMHLKNTKISGYKLQRFIGYKYQKISGYKMQKFTVGTNAKKMCKHQLSPKDTRKYDFWCSFFLYLHPEYLKLEFTNISPMLQFWVSQEDAWQNALRSFSQMGWSMMSHLSTQMGLHHSLSGFKNCTRRIDGKANHWFDLNGWLIHPDQKHFLCLSSSRKKEV